MEKIYKTQTERIDLLAKRGMVIDESSKKILEKYSHYKEPYRLILRITVVV